MYKVRSFKMVGIIITLSALALATVIVILFILQGNHNDELEAQNRDLGTVAVELCERGIPRAKHERQVHAAMVTLGRATTIIAEPTPDAPPLTERGMRFLHEVQRFNRIVDQIEPALPPDDCSLEVIFSGEPIDSPTP